MPTLTGECTTCSPLRFALPPAAKLSMSNTLVKVPLVVPPPSARFGFGEPRHLAIAVLQAAGAGRGGRVADRRQPERRHLLADGQAAQGRGVARSALPSVAVKAITRAPDEVALVGT